MEHGSPSPFSHGSEPIGSVTRTWLGSQCVDRFSSPPFPPFTPFPRPKINPFAFGNAKGSIGRPLAVGTHPAGDALRGRHGHHAVPHAAPEAHHPLPARHRPAGGPPESPLPPFDRKKKTTPNSELVLMARCLSGQGGTGDPLTEGSAFKGFSSSVDGEWMEGLLKGPGPVARRQKSASDRKAVCVCWGTAVATRSYASRRTTCGRTRG